MKLWAALLLSTSLAGTAHAKPAEPDPLKIGEEAPSFSMRTVNPDLAGIKHFALQRYVGASPDEAKSALVLSFAASYCEPCKKELAQLGALKPKLDKANVMLAIVVIDTEPEGAEAMRKLIADDLKLPYPALGDRFGVVAKRYRALSLPFTVIVDKNGVVSWVHSGFQDGSLAALEAKLGI